MTNDDDDAVVYEREVPSHAVELAATLELFNPRQGTGTFSETPLEIEVRLGEQELIDEEGFGIALRFRRVIIALGLENCELARGRRYERTLDPEDFKQFLKRQVETSKIAKGDVKVGTTSALSKVLSAIGIELSAHGEVAAKIAADDLTTIESKIEFKLVRMVAGPRWEIGHDVLGDPLELDGLLKGNYLDLKPDHNTDDAEIDDSNRLAALTPTGRRNYNVIVELRAKKKDFVFKQLDPAGIGDFGKPDNKAIIEGLVCLKKFQEQNRADGFDDLPKDEILLARGRLIAKRSRKRS